MIVKIDISTLRQMRWHEYVVRFVFGGAITVGAGLLARKFGPARGRPKSQNSPEVSSVERLYSYLKERLRNK